MTPVELTGVRTWAAHPSAAPATGQVDATTHRTAGNGTRTCSGGWQFSFAPVSPGQFLSVEVDVTYADLESLREAALCTAYWGDAPAESSRVPGPVLRDHLVPRETAPGNARFSRILQVSEGVDRLTVRCTLRWTAAGRIDWRTPRVEPVEAPDLGPEAVRVAVVTGRVGARPKAKCVQDNVDFYAGLCEAACREGPVDLVALPEIALTWDVGHALDVALRAPGPETDRFADIAARYGARIAVGMHERDGDACYNSLVLVGPERTIEARYRKVHLAAGGENESGVMPGRTFPVARTGIGRIGFNICMDSSAAESARMVGLNGADFLVLAIMGDHRADRWTPGAPIFNPSRWLAIQRTRAMDNQLCMVIARNNTIGSCVIDRKGDVLAFNEGDQDWITASVPRADGRRVWNGGCFRDVNWVQRRPHLYGAYVDPGNYGAFGSEDPD